MSISDFFSDPMFNKYKNKQLSLNISSEMIETIKRRFPNASIRKSELSNIYIKIRCEEGEISLTLKDDNTMTLGQLYKCSGKSGTEMLKIIIELAKDLKTKSISLYDESIKFVPSTAYFKEECGLPLSTLHILMKGESWYQSHGFYSSNDEIHKVNNEEIRQRPFIDFLKDEKDQKEWDELFPDSPSVNICTSNMWKWIYNHKLKNDNVECDRAVFLLKKILEHTPVMYNVRRTLDIDDEKIKYKLRK